MPTTTAATTDETNARDASDRDPSDRDPNDKVVCETPTEGKQPTRIPRWKYELVRGHVLALVDEAGPEGLPLKALSPGVKARLEETASEAEREELGSVSWHAMAVKLDLEVKGELARAPGQGPQRLVRGPSPG